MTTRSFSHPLFNCYHPQIKKNFKCRCGKSYKTAQGLRQHVHHQHPPTSSLTPSPSPKSTTTSPTTNQATALTNVSRTTATSIPSSALITSNAVGITVQSANVIVEPIPTAAAVPSSNGHGGPNRVMMEPVTTLNGTATMMSSVVGAPPLTPTTPPAASVIAPAPAGFTIVTLPSTVQIDGGTTIVSSQQQQVTGAVVMTTTRVSEGGISAL